MKIILDKEHLKVYIIYFIYFFYILIAVLTGKPTLEKSFIFIPQMIKYFSSTILLLIGLLGIFLTFWFYKKRILFWAIIILLISFIIGGFGAIIYPHTFRVAKDMPYSSFRHFLIIFFSLVFFGFFLVVKKIRKEDWLKKQNQLIKEKFNY